MVFALLTAAIIWNLGTWYFGIPNSSSHTLIGSIIGVGIANQLMQARTGDQRRRLGAGAQRRQVAAVFADRRLRAGGVLLSLSKLLIRDPRLYKAPEGDAPPPFWIRCLLILTCTGVSFCARLQRRAKGHGPDHADPDRHGADGLRVEPRHHAAAIGGLYRRFAAGGQRAGQVRQAGRGGRRSARRRGRLHAHQGIQRQHHAGAAQR